MRPVPEPSFAAPRARFVGRRRELDAVCQRLRGGARLVTLWGPAGMGKTRLAVESALALRAHFGGGVFLAELAEARSEAALARIVARALDLTLGPGAGDELDERLVARVGEALAAKGRVLLVADNLEQVHAAAIKALGAFLRAAPEAAFLATSRERLRLPGENAVELLPLPIDGAAELFLDRIGRASEGASLGKALGPLLERLEGIPLAIELCAARFDLLGLEGSLGLLKKRLDAFAGRDRAARHGTLRSALTWSWELLDEADRGALQRLAVFRGSFSAEAGAAVIGDAFGFPLDRIASLRDKSWLRVEPARDPLRPSLLSLFEGGRELAREKLDERPEEREDASRRHAAHLLAASEPALARFEADGTARALETIGTDLESLFALADEAIDGGDARLALRCVLIIDAWVMTRGPFAGHLQRLGAAVALGEGRGEEVGSGLLARGLVALGRARGVAGLFDSAREALERAAPVEAAALIELGIVRHRQGDLAAAEALYGRALERTRATGGRAEARALGNLGAVHHDAGRFEAAIEHYERALGALLAAPAGARDLRLLGVFSTNLGLLEQERSALSEASLRFSAAVEWLSEAGDGRLLAIASGSLGALHHEDGRLEEALAWHERALALLAETGDRRSEALARARAAAVLASLGRADEARSELGRGEALARALGDDLALSTLDTSRAFLDLAASQRAARERRMDGAKASLDAAKARVERARAGTPSAAERSDDVRALLRLFDRTLAATTSEGAADADPEALLVSPGARWMRPPSGMWQDLRKREPARRLLEKLVAEHRSRPGAPVSLDALREAGWPGEKIKLEAARNRVYVALNQLRKLGLSDAIRRVEGGYSLAPDLIVHVLALDPTGAD